MASGKIVLCLVDERNEFQRLLRADAEAAAQAAGLEVETIFSGSDLAAQLARIQSCLNTTPRPVAILSMWVSDRGLRRLASSAAQAGVHWVLLNRVEEDLDEIRRENPAVAISTFCPDEVATGRIQGRQLRRLVPAGGKILYVQGRMRSVAARDRTAGMEEVVQGAPFEVIPVEAGWSTPDGQAAVLAWLRMALRVNRRVDLIACHNDMIAKGALLALDEVARDLGRPEIRKIPVTGCDGSPGLGQDMVRRGELLATIVLPRGTGPAVKALAQTLSTGVLMPPLTLLDATSFPPETELQPLPAPGH